MFNDLSSLINIVKKSAPLLGSALGGPIGGLAASIIANAFGSTTTNPSDLIESINKDPDAALKLKELELKHEVDLKSIDSDDYKAQLTDIQSAREREVEIVKALGKRDSMLDTLALSITAGFFAVIIMVFLTRLDKSDHDVLYMLVGILGTTFTQVYQFYFGASKKSNQQ